MCRQWGYQHYVGPSGTRFGFLKQGLGFESCEWKKNDWEGRLTKGG